MVKIITPAEAADLVKNGDTLALGGFGAYCSPEALLCALEKKYEETASPSRLTVVASTCTGSISYENNGANRLAKPGLIETLFAGHIGYAKKISEMSANNEIATYILPLGVAVHMFRAVASGRPGVLSHVGLNTYADPRLEGCRANEKAHSQHRSVSELIHVGGRELLYYPAIPIDICFIRGTYSDVNGNISINHEALTGPELEIAAATRNSGGIVIVQVEDIVQADMIMPRAMRIHHTLVDYVVKTPSPELHRQSLVVPDYRPSLTGEVKCLTSAIRPLEMSIRKVIARRGAMELIPGSIVNLGVGVPSGIGAVANEEGIANEITLSLEAGQIGGIPLEGSSFSASVNPETINTMCETFDYYDGGYLDMTFLGAAEIDRAGNVNVSRFGSNCPGPGGFINISQNTRKVFFLCTFTAGRSDIRIEGGKLDIVRDAEGIKFVNEVQQITFSAEYALKTGQEVYYITERAVFKLTKDGLCLLEIAPGVDLEKDILDKMHFKPQVAEKLKIMDRRIFQNGRMNLSRSGRAE